MTDILTQAIWLAVSGAYVLCGVLTIVMAFIPQSSTPPLTLGAGQSLGLDAKPLEDVLDLEPMGGIR